MPGKRWSGSAMTCWRPLCRGWRSTLRALACPLKVVAGMSGAGWPANSASDASPSAQCGYERAAGAAESANDRRGGEAHRIQCATAGPDRDPVETRQDHPRPEPELYRQLTEWAASAATDLDVPRVALADAVRAMIRVTAESPEKVL